MVGSHVPMQQPLAGLVLLPAGNGHGDLRATRYPLRMLAV